jgi:hypothetical protein
MKMMKPATLATLIAVFLIAPGAGPAWAYIGAGAGVSLIGSFLGILAAIVLAIAAIFAWPIRKAMKARKLKRQAEMSGSGDASSEGGGDGA